MNLGSIGLRLRSHLTAGWTSGFSQGTIKPPANARPPSSPKSTTSLPNHDAPPSRIAFLLLPPLASPPLTALRRRDTSTCHLWMSPWPRISARPWLSDGRQGRAIRPSRVETLLNLLDAPMAKMLASEEAGLDAASLTELALCTTKATAQAIGRWMSSLVVF